MKLVQASDSNNAELIGFFASQPIKGPIDFRVERVKNFFSHYRLQSENFATYLLLDQEGQTLQGCATLMFREGNVGGVPTSIGYACDLRIASNRKAILKWSEHFLPLTREALKKNNSPFMYSVISNVDPVLMNTLVRPRAQRRNIPTYQLIRKFEIVMILGHWPFLKARFNSIDIVRAEIKDIEPLAHYLKKKSLARPLSYPYSPGFLNFRFQNWPEFRIDSFWLAKDRRGNIIGCVAPWNDSSVQRLVPLRYNGFANSAQTALRFGALFKLTTKLPNLDTPFEIEHLTHFYADNADIFAALLEEAYVHKAPQAALVYSHFHQNPLTLPPKAFIASKVPAALYALTVDGAELPRELLYSAKESPPELELCLA